MAENYGQAAIRHFDDAQMLASSNCFDSAGHLIGFAGECALKFGIVALGNESVRGHFPELIETAKRKLQQRRQTGLHTILKSTQLYIGWSVDMRYHETGSVTRDQYELWKQQTYSILHASGLRRSA